MKPYSAYKDSGLPWVGDIPKHWESRKAKWIFKDISQKGFSDERLLSATQSGGVMPRDMLEDRVVMPTGELTGFKLVEAGDFVISLRSFQGGIEYSEYRGLVSPAYTVLREITPIHKNYYKYLLKSFNFIDELNTAITGIREGKNINYDDFCNLHVLIPPLDEQEAIAKFLDAKLADIDRYIAEKERLIELLQEQKTALINQAVTRGLNPLARMKSSGIEWLCEIPEHWEVSKLSKITEGIGDGLHGTPNYVDKSDYFFINGNNLINGTIELGETAKCVSESEYKKHYLPLNDKTILLSINGTVGNIAFFRGEKVVLGKSAAYITCKDDLMKYFLSYFFQSFAMSLNFHLQVTGTTIYNFSLKSLRNTPILLPPDEERVAITQFLDEKCKEVDKSIQYQKDTVAFVQEYRTALIAEAVTGKMDVRTVHE